MNGAESRSLLNRMVCLSLLIGLWFVPSHAKAEELGRFETAAQFLALQRRHAEVTPLHLLRVMLEDAKQTSTSAADRTLNQGFFRQLVGLTQEDLEKFIEAVDGKLRDQALLPQGKDKPSNEAFKRFGENVRDQAKVHGIDQVYAAFVQMLTEDGPAAQLLRQYRIDENRLKEVAGARAMPGEFLEDLTSTLGVETDPEIRRREQKYEAFTGRENELRSLVQLIDAQLADTTDRRRTLLVGESGTGKTALMIRIAQLIRTSNENVPTSLRGRRVIRIDMQRLVTDTKPLEVLGRFRTILDGACKDADAIVFVDHLNAALPLKQSDGNSPLMPLLMAEIASERRANVILAAGTTEMSSVLTNKEGDPSLRQQIREFVVKPPVKLELLEQLDAQRARIEQVRQVEIPRQLLLNVIDLSNRFLKKKEQPLAAIQLLDEAAALLAFENARDTHESIETLETAIRQIDLRLLQFGDRLTRGEMKEKADLEKKLADSKEQLGLMRQAWERGFEIRRRLAELRQGPPSEEQSSLEKELRDTQAKYHFHYEKLDLYHVAKKIYEETKIPITGILGDMKVKIRTVDKFLNDRVKGQPNAVGHISKLLKRMAAGLKDPKRPMVSIFLGPTGAGKTYLAKKEAEFLFGTEDAAIRIDMANYPNKEDVYKLIGAPPGHVGYDDEPLLLRLVRERPNCVIILDEIEKAHPEIFNILLNILEEGEVANNKGQIVNFRESHIIMTSNLGAETFRKMAEQGISYVERVKKAIEIMLNGDPDRAETAREFKFKPEIVGRVGTDGVVVFDTLTPEVLSEIFELEYAKWETERDGLKGIEVQITDRAKEAIKQLVLESSNQFGAREIRNILKEALESPLGDLKTNEETADAVETAGIMRLDIQPDAELGKAILLDVPDPVDCNKSLARLSKKHRLPDPSKTVSGEKPGYTQATAEELADLNAHVARMKSQTPAAPAGPQSQILQPGDAAFEQMRGQIVKP